MMSVDLLSISWNSSDQKQLVQIPHQLFYPVIDIAMVMKSLIYSLCFYAIFANTVKSIESQSINNKYDESSRRIHMEKMKIFPWVNRINKVNPDVSHEVIVAIEPLNMDYLENSVIERSTPGNKLFQKWMTFDQVGQLTTNREGFNVVQNWLLNENVTITWVHEYSHYIKASASISTWERLLHAEFHEWEREREVNSMETTTTKKPKSVVIRSDSYSVPDFIAPYVSAIFNTVQMPPRISKHYSIKDVPDVDQPYKTDMIFHDKNLRTPKNSKTIDLEDTTIANLVSVTFLDNYYQIPTNIGDPTLQQIVFATAQSTQGSNIGNYYSQSDLNISLGNLGVPDKYKVAHNHNHSKYNIPGSSCSTGMASGGSLDCNEGNLDVQYIMGLAQQVSTVYWYVDSSHIADPFLELLTELFSSKVKSTVVSISYGSIEQEVSLATLKNFQATILQVSAMGVTVIASSGDDGVANYGCNCDSSKPAKFDNCACQQDTSSAWLNTQQTSYYTNNKNTTKFPEWTGVGYLPSFPASCPYVTAVGATQGNDNIVPLIDEGEQSCQSQLGGIITSGGGFSTYYKRPAWQELAASTYLSRVNSAGSAIKPAPGYNPYGRGYPDISLLGVAYSVYIDATIFSLYGTSASAPAFAAMVSLINSDRKKIGNSTVGFLNPSLYSGYTVNGSSHFQDITAGNNKCCSHKPTLYTSYGNLCCGSGFYATTGWDPVTGLGSVRFAQMAKITWTNSITYSPPPTSAPTLLPGFIFGNQSPIVTYIIYAGLGLVIFAILFRTFTLMRSKWQRENKMRRKSRVVQSLEALY